MSDGYLTQDDIDELRAEATKRRDLRLFMQNWPAPYHCDVRTHSVPATYCPNRAFYIIHQEDRKPARICEPCSHGWIHHLTKRGPVTIERL